MSHFLNVGRELAHRAVKPPALAELTASVYVPAAVATYLQMVTEAHISNLRMYWGAYVTRSADVKRPEAMEYGMGLAARVRASGKVKLLFVSTTNMCGSALGESARAAANSSRGVTVRDAGTPAVAMLKPLQHGHIF